MLQFVYSHQLVAHIIVGLFSKVFEAKKQMHIAQSSFSQLLTVSPKQLVMETCGGRCCRMVQAQLSCRYVPEARAGPGDVDHPGDSL